MVPPEMVPSEETVEALIDGLVGSLLSRRGNSNTPTLEQQESVAKQMRAVVLLYNYYHRKLFPKLEFLDFKSFCKISCISKPSLLKFMKSIYKGDVLSEDLEQHLSITEKMIMGACNVSLALDASKNAPIMEGWPISKVAIFLVDLSKEYCLLRSNGGTPATMSIIEKDLETPLANNAHVPNAKNMLGNKIDASLPLQDKLSPVEDILQEIALSTVEKETGISCSNLSILGHHLSYSLTHFKSCSRLYIMSYTNPIDDQIPVKKVMQSLQGPLVRINSGAPEVTEVVQYYSLLPYIDILSDYLFREISHGALPTNLIVNADVIKKESERILVNDSDQGHEKVNNCSRKTSIINESTSKKEGKPPVVDLFTRSQNVPNISLTKEVLPTVNGEAKEDNLSAMKQNLDIMISKKRKVENFLAGSSEAAHHYKASDSSADHKLKSSIRDGETNLSNVISHNSLGNVENGLNEVVGNMNVMIVNRDCHDPLALSTKVDMVSVLQMLKKKRNDLCQQQRLLEDNISHCEMSIMTVLSGNGTSPSEINSMLNTSEFLCSSEIKKDTILSNEARCQPQSINRRRLCEAVLCLRSPCQELDEIICMNNWILPKYCVLPSEDGKFQALVTVRGIDFKSDSYGDWNSSPQEARESSAAHMLSKLRSMATQAQKSA